MSENHHRESARGQEGRSGGEGHSRFMLVQTAEAGQCRAEVKSRTTVPSAPRTASLKNPGWYTVLQNIAPGLEAERHGDLQRHMRIWAHG